MLRLFKKIGCSLFIAILIGCSSDTKESALEKPPNLLGSLEEKQAEPLEKEKAHARIEKKGSLNLIVHEDFDHTWRRTGMALDRLGFTIEDRDRTRGIYFIRYIAADTEEKGFFASFFEEEPAEDKHEYLISLKDNVETTHILVKNSTGKINNDHTATTILTLLYEQLK